jgi:tetratricopeptide (TPR) repeat protein
MKQEINYSRYVDRYLDGVMSASEKNWFEKELIDNNELQSEVDMQNMIGKVLADQETIQLQAQLDEIYQKTYRPWRNNIILSNLKKKPVYIITGLVACAILFTIIILGSIKKSSSSAALYAEYYQPAEINMNFRTAEDLVDSDLRSAMSFYENKEYSKAIVLFEKILESDNSRIGLNLYSGISRMEIQQYAEANTNFKRIIDHKANAFLESAEWYLGLCYLMTDDNDKAKEVFNKIASSNGYYRRDAKRILKKIE